MILVAMIPSSWYLVEVGVVKISVDSNNRNKWWISDLILSLIQYDKKILKIGK